MVTSQCVLAFTVFFTTRYDVPLDPRHLWVFLAHTITWAGSKIRPLTS